MPFPSTLENLLASGYTFLRGSVCPECMEFVEVFKTPGEREIAMDPMCEMLRPAVRHYETCKPKDVQDGSMGEQNHSSDTRDERPNKDAQGRDSNSGDAGESSNRCNGIVADAGAEDGRHEGSLRVGGRDVSSAQIKLHGVTDPNHQLIAVGWSDGVLVCQFKTAKWSYAGVPEAEFVKLRRSPFAYLIFTTNIKNKFPGTKVG